MKPIVARAQQDEMSELRLDSQVLASGSALPGFVSCWVMLAKKHS